MKNPLSVGNKVYFTDDKLPFEVKAISDRYAVVTRKLNKRQDADLLHFEVKRGASSTFAEAYAKNKDRCIYSILDFVAMVRGPHNIIFNFYNFDSEVDCRKIIVDLISGSVEISSRSSRPLEIDFEKSKVSLLGIGSSLTDFNEIIKLARTEMALISHKDYSKGDIPKKLYLAIAQQIKAIEKAQAVLASLIK